MISTVDFDRLQTSIQEGGFAAVKGSVLLEGADEVAFYSFKSEWDDLPLDPCLPDRTCYRLRRYGRFLLSATGELVRMPHAPFYQSRVVNPYVGGIERDFAPMTEASFSNRFLEWLIRRDIEIFDLNDSGKYPGDWEIKIHQIRVETPTLDAIKPTPEGVHRDGHDFLAMHLIGLENADGGESILFDNKGAVAGTYLLANPIDSLLVNDRRVTHEVRPIKRRLPELPAVRDMLLIDFDRTEI